MSNVSVEEWGITEEEARRLLGEQVCPVCGVGGWKNPLNHVARKHGIDRRTMRDACGLNMRESVTAADFHERRVEATLAMRASGTLCGGRVSGAPYGKYQTTRAGRSATAENFRGVSDDSRRANLEKARTARAEAARQAAVR